jgi:DnaJ family protein A protein 5
MEPLKKCYYEILGVQKDSEEAVIRKSYRKLALQYHPDKGGSVEDFRLVQEAYETLSDPVERRWYDDNRESILYGDKSSSTESCRESNIFLFDVTPFHIASCYRGYGDQDGGFYQTYSHVFQEIINGEKKGWLHEGNIDETLFPLNEVPVDFGNSTSSYSAVSLFYGAWEQFSSCLSFSWSDPYDAQLADSRWERRRIEEENNKARKIAKKKRNDDVVGLVAFVKKRDPRVRAARERAQAQKLDQEMRRKAEIERKRVEAVSAREAWAEEKEIMMKQYELDDLNAGRIRLADLDDSEDNDRRGGRSKNKKGRDRRKKNVESEIVMEDAENNVPSTTVDEDTNHSDDVVTTGNSVTPLTPVDNSSSSDDDDFDLWRCEVCRKDFKSESQLDNHVKSKKHKEAVKKLETRLRDQIQGD